MRRRPEFDGRLITRRDYDPGVSEGVEQRIREAHERGELDEAVTLALRHYRDEVYSFLCARLRSESDAHDVFSQLNEDVWSGFAAFRWECSFRTWLYTLARHAALRFERTVANQPGRRRGLSAMPDLEAQARSRTRPYLRTDVKDRFASLRASLTADEQSLLVLRVDRGMSWEQVARVMHGELDADTAELQRETANLRQRFRQLKKRLRERAEADGLLDEADH
jgi:RNA polymerase sigma-70 factor (ECF subfamily)